MMIVKILSPHHLNWRVASQLFGLFATTLSIVYLRFRSQRSFDSKEKSLSSPSKESGVLDDRNINDKLRSEDKRVIVLYGSQTGTAEDYARRLARTFEDGLSIPTILGDMESFDAQTLRDVAVQTKRNLGLVCFVMATYGDGEPTDNAQAFYEKLKEMDASSDDDSLEGLYYLAFGLGNTTYEHYNLMIRSVDEKLQKLGADRVGERGEGDDGIGSLDEDFLSWKDGIVEEVGQLFGIEDTRSRTYIPLYNVEEIPKGMTTDDSIYLGERNDAQLRNKGMPVAPFSAKNPFVAELAYSKQLFAPTCGRHCFHLEFDTRSADWSYRTGDHLGVWPINPEREVERLLSRLGLLQHRDMTVSIVGKDGIESDFPQPTTYKTILRHQVEICGKVSRDTCKTLGQFAPNEEVRTKLFQLESDKNLFQTTVSNRQLNLGQFLELLAGDQVWSRLPFSFLLTDLPSLQPRYYSISSSNRQSPGRIHITAAVKDEVLDFGHESNHFLGLTTNYLKSLADAEASKFSTPSLRLEASIKRAAIHVRQSHFRLPPKPSTPIIMIGPGTGVAPFRAFLQDRVYDKMTGMRVGKTLLFTGCRNREEDYMYAEEWVDCKRKLGDAFELYTAFSREGQEKVYVQHRLQEVGGELFKLLDEAGAWVYICGDAGNMAKDVHSTLIDVVVARTGSSRESAMHYMASVKQSGRMHEDVW